MDFKEAFLNFAIITAQKILAPIRKMISSFKIFSTEISPCSTIILQAGKKWSETN